MRDKVLALVPLIRREAEAGEKLGAMTPDVVNALNEVGFFKITLPREYGGYGFGARDIAEVVGAAATGDGSTAWSGFVSVGLRNAFVFDEQTVSELMADAGSWVGPLMVGASVFSQIVGDARLVDGGFMVRGKWSFGSGCKHAKWAFVGIQWEEGGGPIAGSLCFLGTSMKLSTIGTSWVFRAHRATVSPPLMKYSYPRAARWLRPKCQFGLRKSAIGSRGSATRPVPLG
ncbi:acyl-CoA dehydrogenase family protein [Agrobacterium vitis]|uniref:acyl-CoA dehydrogenase family protein n=1 Tax=Agrobacterium vitis TaxID=373 RepID=UPI0030E4840D